MLRRDDWGYPFAIDGTREPAIPPADLTEARIAVDRCPRLALSLSTTPNPDPGQGRPGIAPTPTMKGRVPS